MPDELASKRLAAAAVVDEHRAQVEFVAADQHDDAARSFVCAQLFAERSLGGVDRGPRSGQDHDARTLAAQGAHQLELALGVALGRGHGDDEPLGVGLGDDAGRDRREVGVGDVGDEQGDRRRRAAGDGLGREVGGVVESGGGLEHALAVLVVDLAGAAVERARRGGE